MTEFRIQKTVAGSRKATGRRLMWLVACSLLFVAFNPNSAFASEDNIDATNKYAYGENAGWQNFRPTHSGGYVNKNFLTGYIWCENVGWVSLGAAATPPGGATQWANTTAANYGVNNDGSGNLSGYGWSENAGWINFNSSHSQVTIDTSTGEFDGYAWSENLGWVHFKNASPAYNVATNWPTVTWDGSSSTAWDTAANWDSNAVPSSTDNVVIPDAATTDNDPTVSSGAVASDLTIQTDGVLNGGSNTFTLSGGWSNSGTFNAQTGTVTFSGTSTIDITGNTTFNNFTCTTATKQINFAAGSTQTVGGILTLTGSSGAGNKITLRSSSSPTKWDLTLAGGAQSVSFVDAKDSDANTNTVTCHNSTDSGNNNANWIFSDIAITSPEDGKTVGTTPVVVGTAGAGDTVVIKDEDSNAVATTTADSSGNFRVAVSTALSTGDNSLTPYVGAVAGTTINVTVDAAPSTDEVPTITSPAEDEEVSGATPTISGKGLAGQTVTVTANDENGNLLLIDVATATVDASGNYTVSALNYTTDLAKGTNYLTVTVGGVTSDIRTVSLTDPFGVVFDSVSNNPVQGATVTIFTSAGAQCTPGVEIAAGDANPQTTGADGAYSFLTINGDFYITVSAAGYTYPSTKSSFPAGRTIVTGSKGEVFTVAEAVIEMDHPMDSSANLLKISKDANKKDVVVGDIVTYTVTIENPTASDVTSVYLEDRIPVGFKYLSGKAILDGSQIANPTGNRPLTFNIGTITSGQTRTLKYQLIVGSGVTFGKYENSVHAKYSDGTSISNTASETVKVIKDPLFDLGTIIGKVFWDWDEDGVQAAGRKSQATGHKLQASGCKQRSEVLG